MAAHKVEITTPEQFSDDEHKALQKEFKSVAMGVLRRRKPTDFDPSIDNVETTIKRRRLRRKTKSAPAKKSGKATKK